MWQISSRGNILPCDGRTDGDLTGCNIHQRGGGGEKQIDYVLCAECERPANNRARRSERGAADGALWSGLMNAIRYEIRDTIRDAIFNVRSKADISQLNLPHGTDN